MIWAIAAVQSQLEENLDTVDLPFHCRIISRCGGTRAVDFPLVSSSQFSHVLSLRQLRLETR